MGLLAVLCGPPQSALARASGGTYSQRRVVLCDLSTEVLQPKRGTNLEDVWKRSHLSTVGPSSIERLQTD